MHNMKHESYESIIHKLKEQRPKTRGYPVISIPICRGVRRIYSTLLQVYDATLSNGCTVLKSGKKTISLYPCQFAEGIRHI